MSKLLYFVSGFVLGAAGGALAHKLYLDYTYKKENQDLYDTYEDIDERYLRKDEVNPTESNTGRENGPISSQEREEIRRKLQTNHDITTNYAEMYKGSEEHPVDSDEDDPEEPGPEYFEDEESEEIQQMENSLDATLEHEANKKKPPKIISYEAVTELPNYIEQDDLFYYVDDDILANEAEEELDPETFIGDALWKYDFANNDETEIYVMNYALDTCYCVTKVHASYAATKTVED